MGIARWLLPVLVVAGCKKQEPTEPDPVPTTPSRGHSITKVKDPDSGSGSGSGSAGASEAGSSSGTVSPTTAGSGSGSGSAARKLYGGDGSPPRLDEAGRPRGPGGPIFMGRGPECSDKLDHCLRPDVWFGVDNAAPGKMYRATPLFEFEGKWYDWRQKPAEFPIRFKTKAATAKTIVPGETVVWLVEANSSKKFLDNEYDALTSSRWTSGTVDSFAGSDSIRVKGWSYGLVPIDTVRVVVERK